MRSQGSQLGHNPFHRRPHRPTPHPIFGLKLTARHPHTRVPSDSSSTFDTRGNDDTPKAVKRSTRGSFTASNVPPSEFTDTNADNKLSKERMPIDIETDDVEAEVRRLKTLGATRWDHQQERGYTSGFYEIPAETNSACCKPNSPACWHSARPGMRWISLARTSACVAPKESRTMTASTKFLGTSFSVCLIGRVLKQFAAATRGSSPRMRGAASRPAVFGRLLRISIHFPGSGYSRKRLQQVDDRGPLLCRGPPVSTGLR